MMKRNFLTPAAAVALTLRAIVIIPASGTSQTAPPMGGGYTNVIPIPIDDPTIKNIAGAFFKPSGSGPSRAGSDSDAKGGDRPSSRQGRRHAPGRSVHAAQ